ncbi:S1 family peptidase [Klebsiella michiganensis]|uniref:S1 family peptidase n=1 Tax=Klebsiella michiganensis TaxID=1134687 RepID=UPI000C99A1D8|nr:serine protease [Klebsiella michiganensis]
MPISQSIFKSTVRIESDVPGGISVGTGFWFDFHINEFASVPILVTNKHVVNGATETRIRINTINNSTGEASFFDHIIHGGEKKFIMHPDASVDLCAYAIGSTFMSLEASGISPDVFLFNEKDLLNDKFITPVEEVHMTGYPNGLWDSLNNRPITRRGITASSVLEDWRGRQEFMIDMACFGGSSGSPVYVLNVGMFATENGFAAGERFILLGVLYAGPTVNVGGEVEIINVPTTMTAVVNTSLVMNLGLVIKAEKILDFKKLVGQ